MIKPIKPLEPFYQEKFDAWLESHKIGDGPELEQLKVKVDNFLTETTEQSIQEYMLQRKYNQLHDIYKPEITTNLFGQTGYTVSRSMVTEMRAKANIWVQDNLNDYLDLEPELILTNKNTKYNGMFNALRLFTSTGENNNNIGRNLYYIIRDKKTQKYLGTINLSSDYLDVKCRDAKIGWTREQRNAGRIGHTSVGSIIVPTQPLGFNYVGGKLLSLLLVTDQVQDDWQRLYKDKLVGLSTTSFYGTFSQYTGLKYWKNLGKSMGSSVARPPPALYAEIREWLKANHTQRYWEWYHATDEQNVKIKRDHINRSMVFAFSQFGFKRNRFITGHQRGIYFCPLYTNTSEYLREDIEESELIKKFDNSVSAMTELWKTKYAVKRIRNIQNRDAVLDEVLFYDDMLFNDWETIKEKYMPQVGR